MTIVIVLFIPTRKAQAMSDTHATAPTRYIEVDGDRFAYRRWGKPSGVPIFLVQHLRGGMDHWDPLLTDGLAEGREVILFNGRGISSASGTPRNRMEDMADDIAAVIRALGLEHDRPARLLTRRLPGAGSHAAPSCSSAVRKPRSRRDLPARTPPAWSGCS